MRLGDERPATPWEEMTSQGVASTYSVNITTGVGAMAITVKWSRQCQHERDVPRGTR
jgi:hypothetical protein